MAEQLSFPGFEPGGRRPAKPRPKLAWQGRQPFNLFFALRPALDDARSLEALGRRLAQAHGMQSRPLAVEHLHVSLHGLGGYDVVPQWMVDRASDVAQGLALPALDVAFDEAMVFRGGNRPYVLRNHTLPHPLEVLWRTVGMAMADAFPLLKFKPDFSPHMTVAYQGRLGLVHAVEPLRWPAHELVLINSHQGKTVHEVLGRWLLPRA